MDDFQEQNWVVRPKRIMVMYFYQMQLWGTIQEAEFGGCILLPRIVERAYEANYHIDRLFGKKIQLPEETMLKKLTPRCYAAVLNVAHQSPGDLVF